MSQCARHTVQVVGQQRPQGPSLKQGRAACSPGSAVPEGRSLGHQQGRHPMPPTPGSCCPALHRVTAAAPAPGSLAPLSSLGWTLTLVCVAAGCQPGALVAQGGRPSGAAGPPPPPWPSASVLPCASARPVLWLQFLRKRDKGLARSQTKGCIKEHGDKQGGSLTV